MALEENLLLPDPLIDWRAVLPCREKRPEQNLGLAFPLGTCSLLSSGHLPPGLQEEQMNLGAGGETSFCSVPLSKPTFLPSSPPLQVLVLLGSPSCTDITCISVYTCIGTSQVGALGCFLTAEGIIQEQMMSVGGCKADGQQQSSLSAPSMSAFLVSLRESTAQVYLCCIYHGLWPLPSRSFIRLKVSGYRAAIGMLGSCFPSRHEGESG